MRLRSFFAYGWYLARHKWFVLVECWKVGLYWRGLKHDWTKLLPCEFFPYMHFFHEKDGKEKQRRDDTGYYKPEDTGDPDFDRAWFHHQKYNDHHWQWWTLPREHGGLKVLEMSPEARLEMLCDWKGAGRAQGFPNIRQWYVKNGHKMSFGRETRAWVEKQLGLEDGLLSYDPREIGLIGQEVVPWPPKGAPPEFGNTTSAKPYQGQPDLDLSRKVGQLLHGACDPQRRLDHSEVVAVYEDGSKQVVFEKKGHHRVVVEEWAGRVLFDTWVTG
jgi:Family of unknown function (DUF5662)